MGRTSMRVRVLALAAAVVAVAAVSVSVAGAASSTKNGVTVLAPKNGTVVPTVVASGATPTFKARVRGKGTVYFTICKSKKRDSNGQLCRGTSDAISRGTKGKKTKRGRNYSFKPIAYTFPTYYLNTPGTYYWQVFRIACKRKRKGGLDCTQESPLKKFVVQ